MSRTVSVGRYRQLAIITTVGICLLVVAGGVVRLTGSGLGCDDWPNCNETRFIDVSSGHAAIEQINRIFSGLIGIPTLALATASFFVRGRTGLRWPAIGVLLTVLANGVVGGIAVRGDLHPALVQSHFLLAMLSIAFGMIAIHRSGRVAVRFGSMPTGAVALATLTAAALATGTVVTGTGPHAGEEDVRRFGFDISNVARIHSVTVIAAIAVGLFVAWQARERGTDAINAVSAWMFTALLQGALGYAQYFNDVPELLVGIHIAGATILWVMTLRLVLQAWSSAVAGRVDDEPETLAGEFAATPPAHV